MERSALEQGFFLPHPDTAEPIFILTVFGSSFTDEKIIFSFDRGRNRLVKLISRQLLRNRQNNDTGQNFRSIPAVRALKDGVIADFKTTAKILPHVCQKGGKPAPIFSKPRVIICMPSGVTEVERKAVEDAAYQAGAKPPVVLIEEPMAAAIGAGMPVDEPCGSMVVDIGGGTSEVAVISLGDIVTACSVRVAGDKFDEAISTYVKRKYNLLIGERTAEDIKMKIGSAYPGEEEKNLVVKGRNIPTSKKRIWRSIRPTTCNINTYGTAPPNNLIAVYIQIWAAFLFI